MPALLFFVTADAQSTRERLDNLEARLARLERLLQNSQSNQTQMLGQMNELQAENQELRNQLETLQFESGKSGDRERELYMDLDSRLEALESRGAAAPGAAAAGGAAAASAAGSGNDQQDYQRAFGMLREGRYAEAEAAFLAAVLTATKMWTFAFKEVLNQSNMPPNSIYKKSLRITYAYTSLTRDTFSQPMIDRYQVTCQIIVTKSSHKLKFILCMGLVVQYP